MIAEDGPPIIIGMKPKGWPLTIRSMPIPSMAPPIRPPVTPEEMPSQRMSPRVIMSREVWGFARFGKGRGGRDCLWGHTATYSCRMSSHPNSLDSIRHETVHCCEASHDVLARPRGGRPAALLGFALGWLVLSAVGSGVLAVLVVGGLNRLGWLAWRDFEADVTTLGLPLQQAVMVFGSVHRGWRAGAGDLRAGLGWLPVRRFWLVAGLAACALLLGAAQVELSAVSPAVHDFLERAAREMVGPPGGSGAHMLWITATIGVGAPVAEEMFFRGWLWVELRRRWGAWGTGLTTGGVFLLLHGAGGEWRLLVALAPVAVVLSLARELGGSVRASLAVHVTNNVVVTAYVAAGWLAR